MTGLRTWRKIVKRVTIFFFGWEVATTIVSLALLILVAVQGGAPSPDRLIFVVGTLGLYGVVIWAVWDARRRTYRRSLKPVAPAEEA